MSPRRPTPDILSLDEATMSLCRPTPIYHRGINQPCLHLGLLRHVIVGSTNHISIQAYVLRYVIVGSINLSIQAYILRYVVVGSINHVFTQTYSDMSSLGQPAMSPLKPTPIYHRWINQPMSPMKPLRYIIVGPINHVSIQSYSDMSSWDQSTMSPFKPTPICYRWINGTCLHLSLLR